jgi:hypothetical protein
LGAGKKRGIGPVAIIAGMVAAAIVLGAVGYFAGHSGTATTVTSDVTVSLTATTTVTQVSTHSSGVTTATVTSSVAVSTQTATVASGMLPP